MPKVASTRPGPIPPGSATRRIGILWLPLWQTDRLRRERDEPFPLVTFVQLGSRRMVSAACAKAGRRGLRPGMMLAKAQAMIPDLVVRPARPQEDDAALDRLARWCRRYTPHTRAEPPDSVWLDLTGCAHLFDGETVLLDDLAGRVRQAGFSVRAAIAPTQGAAHALARHAAAPLSVLAHAALPEALPPLPVAALRLPPDTLELLHRFGLHRIGDLAALPRDVLASRLGPVVLLRLDQAFDRVAEPGRPDEPVPVFRERMAFIEPLRTADALSPAIDSLVGLLCTRLAACGLGARRFELVFVRLDGSCCEQSLALSRPGHDAVLVARLLGERLERVDPGEGIETMWLLVRLAEPVGFEQSGLPDRRLSEPDPDRALSVLIDTLRNRLGSDRLWRPLAVESDVPERSVRRGSPGAVSAGGSSAGGSSGWPDGLPRPVRLIEPPQPVRALAALPDHAPAAFVWRRRRHRVVRADGPERIAGEWWRRDAERDATRDYFRVEDENGRRFWLFRRGNGLDPATGDLAWFLHGLF